MSEGRVRRLKLGRTERPQGPSKERWAPSFASAQDKWATAAGGIIAGGLRETIVAIAVFLAPRLRDGRAVLRRHARCVCKASRQVLAPQRKFLPPVVVGKTNAKAMRHGLR